MVLRVEVDLGGDLAGEAGGVEADDPTHSRAPGPYPRPELLDAGADRGDGADAGDRDTLSHDRGLPSRSNRGSRPSTIPLIVASVLPAMASTKCGPMMRSAIGGPTSGQPGVKSWSM